MDDNGTYKYFSYIMDSLGTCAISFTTKSESLIRFNGTTNFRQYQAWFKCYCIIETQLKLK